MKHLLELILKKTGKDWGWLSDWCDEVMCFDNICGPTCYSFFEDAPKLLTLLVIDLGPELWKENYAYTGKDMIWSFIHTENKIEWLTKQLER